MLPDTMEEWVGSGIVTLVIAIITLLWKIKQESHQAVEEAKKVAIDASASAVGVVQAAMVTQDKQVSQLNDRVNDLNVRVTSLDHSNRIAIRHIADREVFAINEWADRPTGLPAIPAEIIKDVIEHRPSIRLYYQPDVVEEEIIYSEMDYGTASEEEEEDDDVDPKEGYSGYG